MISFLTITLLTNQMRQRRFVPPKKYIHIILWTCWQTSTTKIKNNNNKNLKRLSKTYQQLTHDVIFGLDILKLCAFAAVLPLTAQKPAISQQILGFLLIKKKTKSSNTKKVGTFKTKKKFKQHKKNLRNDRASRKSVQNIQTSLSTRR